jgi:hypothetical protein
LATGPAQAAANNLAWLYFKQNRLLDEAEALARRALAEGSAAGLDPKALETFNDTLNEIQKAKKRHLLND